MRQVTLIVLVIIMLPLMLQAQMREPGWITQNTGLGQDYMGVYSASDSVSWMVGTNGYVVYTEDAGETWVSQNSGVNAQLWSVSFADENNGTATGYSGAIVHTTDGGENWDVIQDGWMLDFFATKMVDENIAFVAGKNTIMAPLITYTTDGWDTMNSITFYLEQTPGNFHEGTLYGIEYIDADNWITAAGVWQGDGAIARTTDGGSNWDTIYWTSNSLYAIHFPSETYGYAAGQNGAFVRSNDGGDTWTQVVVPGAPDLFDVYFISDMHGWVSGDGGFISMTTDGGLTWSTQNTDVYSPIYSIHFVDEMVGRAAAENDLSLYTTSGGMEAGTLNGTVTLDAGDGNVEDVTISVGDMVTNPNENGFYELELMPGIYELTAELEPYDSVTISDIEILSGAATTVDITLLYNICAPPQNLEVDDEDWLLYWEDPDSSLEIVHFNIYFEGEFLVSTEEMYTQLPVEEMINGEEYTAGVSTEYDECESEIVTITFVYTGTDADDDLLVGKTAILGNYPNPFNPDTTIKFSLAEADHVKIDIFNMRGQVVRNLVYEHKTAGTHHVTWNGRDNHGEEVTSGIYFYRLTTTGTSETRKMMLLK